MNSQARQRGAAKAGLIVAVALAAVFAVALSWMALTRQEPKSDQDDFTDVPSITKIINGTESGGGLSLQFADKDDPSRVAATLQAENYQPVESNGQIEPNLYQLDNVHARVFLDSGETVLIESDQGRFFMPDKRGRPESGSLIGHPKITLFPAGGEDREPTLTATFDQTLRFNFNYSHVDTPGRVHVVGRGVEFAGSNLEARLNQQRERIDVLEVQKGEFLKYDPALAKAGRTKPAETATPASSRPQAHASAQKPPTPPAKTARATRQDRPATASEPAREAPAPATPQESLYLATFQNSVELTQGERRITADQLESWVRLIDHKLPERTRGRSPSATAPHTPLAMLAESVIAQIEDAQHQNAPAPVQAAPANAINDDEPIVLRWMGQLRIIPLLGDTPEQLTEDDADFRFTSTDSGLVRFEDQQSSGYAAAVNYAATQDVLTLTGPGGSVHLESTGQGFLEASKTVVRLGTGSVSVIGPGQVTEKKAESDAQHRYVRWIDQADFQFAVENDRMTGAIETASFAGKARAVDGERRVDGDVLNATFQGGADGNRLLSKVEATEASAVDGRGASMTARHIEVPFAVTSPGRSDADALFASGDVVIKQDVKTIAAQSLSADLSQDENGGLRVSDVVAERDVRYTEGDTIAATADRVEGNGIDSIAVLIGDEKPARIDYGDSVVEGPRIELADHPQRGRVVGAGTFARRSDEDSIHADWIESMSFDRSFGVLECLGDAHVAQVKADGEIRTASGRQLTVELVDRDGELTFQSASVFANGEQRATVETKTVADDAVVSLMNLTADEILATDAGSALVVPTAGRLVVLDRTAGGAEDLDGWDRGHALCTWQHSLVVDRKLGTARLSGDAHVIHKTMDDGRIAELAADTIFLTFVENQAHGAQITSMDATANAYFRMESREIIGSVIRFDAQKRIVHAEAAPNEPLRFIDGVSGAVTTARSLDWNLETDRIELDRPSPLVVPRGG